MVNYELADLYLQNSIDKQMKIYTSDNSVVITNENIHEGTFELEETLCSEETITIGSCEANSIKFTYSTDSTISLKDKWLNVESVLEGNKSKPFKYGIYKVYSDLPTSDRKAREIVAYDYMYDIINADVTTWFNNMFGMETKQTYTLRQIRDSFFNLFNIEQESCSLVNDNIYVSFENKNVSSVSGKTIINYICEVNGVFGTITRDNKFRYVELKKIEDALLPSNTLYPSDKLYPRNGNTFRVQNGCYISCEYEDYQTKPITKVSAIDENGNSIGDYGTGDNVYKISNNFFLNNMSNNDMNVALSNIYNKLENISYIPIKSSDCLGNPCIELGDNIKLVTSKKVIKSYVLERTLKGVQALRDSYASKGTYELPKTSNSIFERIDSLEGKSNVFERNIDETLSEIYDPQTGKSRIDQVANEISLEVTRAKNSEGDLSSRITQTADKVAIIIDGDGKIKAAEIVAEINEEGSLVRFNADKIKFEGATIAESFECKDLKITGGSVKISADSSNERNYIEFVRNYGSNTYKMSIGDSSVGAYKNGSIGFTFDADGYFNTSNTRHNIASGAGINGLRIKSASNSSNFAYYDYDSVSIQSGSIIIFGADSNGIIENGSYLSNKYLQGSDGNWYDVSFSSYFQNYSNSNQLKYRKWGKVVEILGEVTTRYTITGSDTKYTIFTLPSGYIPSRRIVRVMQGSFKNTWTLTVETNGEVTFSRYGVSSYVDTSENVWLPIDVTFLVD